MSKYYTHWSWWEVSLITQTPRFTLKALSYNHIQLKEYTCKQYSNKTYQEHLHAGTLYIYQIKTAIFKKKLFIIIYYDNIIFYNIPIRRQTASI